MTKQKKEKYERLLPFLHRKSARQRIGLYLLGIEGYTVPDLVKMTIAEIRAIRLPVEMTVYLDEMLDERKSGLAFVYPNGQAVPYTGWHRLVRSAAKKAIGRPMSAQQFRAYMLQKRD